MLDERLCRILGNSEGRILKGIGEFASTEDAVHFARDMLSAVGRLFDLWYRFRGEAGPAKDC